MKTRREKTTELRTRHKKSLHSVHPSITVVRQSPTSTCGANSLRSAVGRRACVDPTAPPWRVPQDSLPCLLTHSDTSQIFLLSDNLALSARRPRHRTTAPADCDGPRRSFGVQYDISLAIDVVTCEHEFNVQSRSSSSVARTRTSTLRPETSDLTITRRSQRAFLRPGIRSYILSYRI